MTVDLTEIVFGPMGLGQLTKGGVGSGNFGHAGRQGEVGGSGPGEISVIGTPPSSGVSQWNVQRNRIPLLEADAVAKIVGDAVDSVGFRRRDVIVDAGIGEDGTLGQFNNDTGKMTIYAGMFGEGQEKEIEAVVVHEATHAKFFKAFGGDDKAGPLLQRFVDEAGGIAKVRNEGSQVSPYAMEHWTSEAISALERGGHIKKVEWPEALAINETLAEIAANERRHGDRRPVTLLGPLYRHVKEIRL